MDFSFPVIAVISLLFFGVAFLYSSVGHGGASGYLAVLSFFTVPAALMSTTALILNVLVAGTALIAYTRAKHLVIQLTWPFVIASVPTAFLGGLVRVSTSVYLIILAAVLFLASLRFLFEVRSRSEEVTVKSPSLFISLPIGAAIGFLSGVVGVGGGIFLSPLILMMGWADPKRTAATSAAFILVNSLAGLSGRFTGGNFEVEAVLALLVAAFIGGLVGSHFGAMRYSNQTIKRALGVVLLIASIKLIIGTV